MTKPKIEAVIFDVGNVLLHLDFDAVYKLMSAHTHLKRGEIEIRLKEQSLRKFETGQVDSEEFFTEQKLLLEFKGSWQELEKAWIALLVPKKEVIAIAKKLHGKYKLGILSNTNATHEPWIESYDFIAYFSERVYSHKVGAMKPDAEIYHHTVKVLKLDPETTLFIDDLYSNVEAARSHGWNVIHLKPEVNLADELKLLGIDL